METIDEIKDRTETYKNLKKTRPNFKRALKERDKIVLLMLSFGKFLEGRTLIDNHMEEILKKIELYNELLFMIEIYITETKIYLDIK